MLFLRNNKRKKNISLFLSDLNIKLFLHFFNVKQKKVYFIQIILIKFLYIIKKFTSDFERIRSWILKYDCKYVKKIVMVKLNLMRNFK